MLTNIIETEIKSFLKLYFDALYEQDMNKFDQVFHQDCVLYVSQYGEYAIRPYTVYRRIVSDRLSPKAGGYPRKEEILMIDILSDTMALAKVRLQLYNNVMENYLNLLKIDSKWIVVSKLYYKASTTI